MIGDDDDESATPDDARVVPSAKARFPRLLGLTLLTPNLIRGFMEDASHHPSRIHVH